MGWIGSPDDECDPVMENRFNRVLARVSFEYMTTVGRLVAAVAVESWLFSDEKFTGVDRGGFVYNGKFRCTLEWLTEVGKLKITFWLNDQEIDDIILQVTPGWAYVVWEEVEAYISQMDRTENGGDN